MNILRKSYYVLRHLGPGFAATRLRLLLDKRTSRTRRLFASRTWSDIDRSLPPPASSDEGYAGFKRQQGTSFFFPLGVPPRIADANSSCTTFRTPSLAERIELLAQGRVTYFLERPSPSAVNWYDNPFGGGKGRNDQPWHDIPDFTPDQGDARMLWEPSRAAWAIDLARAAALRGAPRSPTQGCHAERSEASESPQGVVGAEILRFAQNDKQGGGLAEEYWRLVDSWMEACPPWKGFQWKCGQEASVRFVALAVGFWTFAEDPATTPARWKQFARLAWATGYRVFHHIDYALSQKNNHALSEALGLMLVAHLFPEFRESQEWGQRGRGIFEGELPRQIYDDGSYIQHSMNYHRVMLHVSLVAFRLAELSGRPFDRSLYERLGKAGDFLLAMMDPDTGEVPRYGHNDGSCVLPLSECPFWDFRPVVAATHFLVHRKHLFDAGPWDEDLLWLFGEEAAALSQLNLRGPTQLPNYHAGAPETKLPNQRSFRFDAGGYYTLRQRESWAMVRCHTYRDRPGQCDPLHVDLWWRGLNVLRDCGTFQYYAPGRPDLEEYFVSLRAHNTIEIDGAQPYERSTRFLWFPWPKARILEYNGSESHLRFVGERYCYARRPWNVIHRRTVSGATCGRWSVVDELCGTGSHSAVLRWHLCDAEVEVDSAGHKVDLRTAAGMVRIEVGFAGGRVRRFEIIRGRDEVGHVPGFHAPQYGLRTPAPLLEVEVEGTVPIRIETSVILGPG